MPNWKKIALSGSNPEFASLTVDNAITASAFTGSFTGDGSGLSNVSATVTEQVTVTDTFTSVTSSTVTHTFDTKNVIVQVYDNSDNLVIPQSITTSTTGSVDIVFDSITSGRVIVAKGGHIVSGSITTTIASSSTVSDTFTAQTSYTASHTFGTSDVFVQVYDNTDSLILPQKVKILTTGSIGLDFDTATTGKVIIGKSGHIVSGSAPASTVTFSNVTDKPALISSSAQIATDISGSFTSTSASIASDIANISTDFGSITNNPFTASGNQITASGHIIPSANDTYDLGSTTKQWRDLFLSSGSLYIDGTKIVSSDATTLTFTTDTGQSIKLLETGADDIILQTDSGNIELKGTVEILTGKKITDSASTKVLFGDSIGITGSIDLTGTVDGVDLQAFSSSVATGLASSTADYTQLTNVPSGIISSSTQIASDISGSFTAASASISNRLTTEETNVDNLQSFSSSLSSTIISYTGSFSGDGSSLTGITAAGTLSSSAQIASDISGSLSATAIAALGADILSGSGTLFSQSFSSATAVTASHNFGTKDVVVSTYDSNDNLFFPTNIQTFDTNNVHISFNVARTGRVVVSKGGHVLQSAANAATASFASTGPFLSNTGGTVDGDLTLTGTLTAQTYIVSSSVTYMTQSFSSGSTIFGDSLDDTHLFTGSLNVTGSANLVASQSVNNNTSSGSLSFWQGSESEYNAISNSADNNTIYFVV